MAADTAYQEEDIYAENVTGLLASSGIVSDDEQEEMKRFLRGW